MIAALLISGMLAMSSPVSDVPLAGISVLLEYQESYSAAEVKLLEQVVEAEATAGGVKEKKNVASAIINRVHSEEFKGKTIKDIVYQPSQFSSVGDKRYITTPVTETTKQAVREVLQFGPNHEGLWFCNPEGVTNKKLLTWFRTKLQFLFKDEINHYYYK